jgi:hypothetical protein
MTAAIGTILEYDGVTDSFLSNLRVLDRLGYRVTGLTYIMNVFYLFSNFGLAM